MSLPSDWPSLVVILRRLPTGDALAAADALIAAGVRAIEVTVDSPGAADTITELSGRDSRLYVGAGTVRTLDHVELARRAGARFLLSPHLDPAIVTATREAGLLSMPGACTPTEVHTASAVGADLVKLFPVQPAGPDYIAAIREPLPDIPLLACGGLTAELSRTCLELGCTSVAAGAGMIDADALRRRDWDQLRRSAAGYLSYLSAVSACPTP